MHYFKRMLSATGSISPSPAPLDPAGRLPSFRTLAHPRKKNPADAHDWEALSRWGLPKHNSHERSRIFLKSCMGAIWLHEGNATIEIHREIHVRNGPKFLISITITQPFPFANIWYNHNYWSGDSRYTANGHGQRVKGQGHIKNAQ